MNEYNEYCYYAANEYLTEDARSNNVQLLRLIDKNYDDKNKTLEDTQKDLISYAGDYPGKSDKDDFNIQVAKAISFLKKSKRDAAKEATTSATPDVTVNDNKPGEPIIKDWPKYDEFRKKWYRKTVELGWPKNFKSPFKDPEKDGDIVYPWSSVTGNPYSFNVKGWSAVTIKDYSKDIKKYLFNKFENNIKGLDALYSQITKIVETEKEYFKSKAISFLGGILMYVFKGLGATQGDEAFMNFLISKLKGMTIFQFQEAIVLEVMTKMKVSDDTSENLKNILYPLRKLIESDDELKGYIISKVSVEYSSYEGYSASFKVTTPTGKLENIVKPFYLIIKNIVLPIANGKGVTFKSGKFDEAPNVTMLETLIKTLDGQLENKKANLEKLVIGKSIKFVKYSYENIKSGKQVEKSGSYVIGFEYKAKGAVVKVVYLPEE